MPKRFAFLLGVLEAGRDDLRQAQHEEYCTEEDLYVAEIGGDAKTKVTDVKAMVKAHPKMRAAFRARMGAESRFKHAEAAVKAVEEARKDMYAWCRYREAEMRVMVGTEED